MTDIFADVAQALANLLNTSTTIAGYILGTVVCVSFFIMIMLVLSSVKSKADSGLALVISGSIGVIFSVLVGWFDEWTVVFIAIVMLFVVVNPISKMSGG